MKPITNSLLDFYADTHGGFYQMTNTAELVREAAHTLWDVRTLEEYVALAGELSVHISRMDYWVTLLILWAKGRRGI